MIPQSEAAREFDPTRDVAEHDQARADRDINAVRPLIEAVEQVQSPAVPIVMPGPSEQIAEEVKMIGPEGAPGDPKAGPGLLIGEVGLLVLMVSIAAFIVGWTVAWLAGAFVMALGLLGLLLNPAVVAAFNRAGDRKKVFNNHVHG